MINKSSWLSIRVAVNIEKLTELSTGVTLDNATAEQQMVSY